MHELSIAESVVQVASRHAEGRRVTKVYLKVGHLRQVVPSALAFSFELVAHGTPAEGAELEMQQVPATGVCKDCGEESRLAAVAAPVPARIASGGDEAQQGEGDNRGKHRDDDGEADERIARLRHR